MPGRATEPPTWRPSDLEAYCYLKRYLPAGWTVSAEPSASYFSEWQFRYRVSKGDTLIAELAGDFREIEPGSLSRWALRLIEESAKP